MTDNKHLTGSSKPITTLIRLIATGRERQLALVGSNSTPIACHSHFIFVSGLVSALTTVTSVLLPGSFAGLTPIPLNRCILDVGGAKVCHT